MVSRKSSLREMRTSRVMETMDQESNSTDPDLCHTLFNVPLSFVIDS